MPGKLVLERKRLLTMQPFTDQVELEIVWASQLNEGGARQFRP